MRLKESENLETVKQLHTQLWESLLERDEVFAENYLKRCIKKLKQRKVTSAVGSYMKTSGFWVSVLVGAVVVPIIVCFLVWAALLTE
jgi:hypothetical protein